MHKIRNFLSSYLWLSQLEFLKFSRNATIVTSLAIFLVCSVIGLIVPKKIFLMMEPPFPNGETFYEFPTVWDYQGYAMNWFVSIFLAFIIIQTIHIEIANKTLRQNIITGMTRSAFFQAKLVNILNLSIFATLLYVVSTVVIGLIHTPGFDLELVFDSNLAMLRFFIMCVGYLSFALLMALIFRKGNVVVITYLAYVFILELILRSIHLNAHKSEAVLYWPMNVIEDNMPLPLLKISDFVVNTNFGFGILLPDHVAMIGTSFYSGLFLFLAWKLLEKKDI